jgi:RNA polymerase sigma-70 factor (ECF subfamily)
MSHERHETVGVGGGRFPPTSWSVVLAAAASQDDTRGRDALARLCQSYWFPLYAYARRHGYGPEDAQDLTQGFFALVLEKNCLAVADPSRGRFRSFLLTAFKNFLANERERTQAQKRGGGEVLVPLDADTAESRYACELADQLSPDKLYERLWVLTLLDRVLGRLRAEQMTQGKLTQFQTLQRYLTGDQDAPSYAEVASQLGTTPASLRMAVGRLRRRYRTLLEDEIAQTVRSPAEAAEELRHLFAVLTKA